MYDLIIEDATIVTADTKHTVIESGLVLISEGVILGVHDTKNPICGDLKAKVRLNASGKLLMPGIINMHCHAADSLFRGLVENLALEDWLSKVWIAEKNILTPETTYLGSVLGLAENLLAGVTTVMDMFWYPDRTAQAAKDLGLRIATGGIFFDPPGVGERGHADYKKEATDFFIKHSADDFVFPMVMPHGTYTVSPKNLKEAKQLCDHYGGLFSTHAAETQTEQSDIKNRYGKSVVRHLHDLKILGPNTSLAHCVHVDTTEINLIVDSGTAVVHNPVSNLKLGSGIPPIGRFVESGALVTLGTDGAISGNDLDMWMALRLAATLPKGYEMRPNIIDAKEALHMFTLNGAKALGKESLIGSIEVGKKADLILVNAQTIHSTPMFDPITHLVYSTSKSDVTDVFVEGLRIVENGVCTTLNLENFLSQVRSMTSDIKMSLNG